MFEDPNTRNLVAEVSTKEVVVYGKGNSPKIIAYDCGMKFNIIRYLVDTHNVELTVVPQNALTLLAVACTPQPKFATL